MTLVRTVAVCLLVAAAASVAMAQDTSSAVKGEMLFWISDAQEKLEALADAIPEDKYGWSPSKDVRTTGQIFMHVAAANYGLPTFWGVAAPEGFSFQTYEKSLTKKADIRKALSESFAHMKKSLEMADEAAMNKEIDLFGHKATERSGYFLLLSHAHEHLGQAIAYARSVGVVPPWSMPKSDDSKK